jgi:hypothetical protein
VDSKYAILISIASAAIGCAEAQRPFALRPPLQRDTDLDSVRVACRPEPTPKDPKHVSCAPHMYVSPLAWDGIDNSIFRPLSDVLAVRKIHEATNANSLDEVADSAWFTNRIGAREYTVDDLRLGACDAEQFLDSESAAPGSWVIDKGKDNGSTPGFRVRIAGKGKYLFKVDAEEQPERATAASVIGAAVYHAVGFFTSCEQVVYFDRSVLKLTPGLESEDNSGVRRAFDEKALEKVLSTAPHKGNLLRMQASAWLPGYLIGPFRYEGTRDDDPNDAIPHEDRRELRGGRVLAAWLDHFDAREQNSMDTWMADQADRPDSSPGYVRHYYLDMSDCLGSEWAWDGISRRLGHSYLLDWGDIAADFGTLGIPTRVWEEVERTPGREKFGYFDVDTFDPEAWKNEYPNAAFSRMTERDGAWMARILAHFTPDMVRALADLGRFADPSDTTYLADALEARLQKILDRYLLRLSPLGEAHIEDGATLCAIDLARLRKVRDESAFRYTAREAGAGDLESTVRDDGSVCVALPASSASAASSPRYSVVSIENGVADGALEVHLYDLGPERGYQIAGVSRDASRSSRAGSHSASAR